MMNLRPFFRWIGRFRWLLLSISLVLVVLLIFASPPPRKILLGIYDPARMFQQPAAATIEHHFVPWRPDQAQELEDALRSTQKNQRIPMITLEPWPWNVNGMDRATLLQDITNGRYDPTIDRCLKMIQMIAPQKVVLRWGHEMELVGQYPWSVAEASQYIAAYRHLVARSQQLKISNILWLWSPAGNANAIAYWPGEDVVDLVGISIYATVAWHPDGHNSLPSFERLMQQKYGLAKRWLKPVIIAEVGVEGSPAVQEAWVNEAIQQLHQFPKIAAWVYFNQIQPEIVPLAIGRPDWSLKLPQVQYLEKHWPIPQNQTDLQPNLLESLLEGV